MKAVWNGQVVDAEIHIDEDKIEEGGLAVIRDEDGNELGEAVIQGWNNGSNLFEPLYFIELPQLSDQKLLNLIRKFESWYGEIITPVDQWAVEFQLLVRMLVSTYGGSAYLLINPDCLDIDDEMWKELSVYTIRGEV